MENQYIVTMFDFDNGCCTSQSCNNFTFFVKNMTKNNLINKLIEDIDDIKYVHKKYKKDDFDKLIDYIIKKKYIAENNLCECGKLYIVSNSDDCFISSDYNLIKYKKTNTARKIIDDFERINHPDIQKVTLKFEYDKIYQAKLFIYGSEKYFNPRKIKNDKYILNDIRIIDFDTSEKMLGICVSMKRTNYEKYYFFSYIWEHDLFFCKNDLFVLDFNV